MHDDRPPPNDPQAPNAMRRHDQQLYGPTPASAPAAPAPRYSLLATLILGVIGLAALASSLCGGLFTLAGITNLLSGSADSQAYATGFLIIALPSFVFGGLLAWWIFRKGRGRWWRG